MSDEPHHSGTIALIGRPNAGKSTLLNAILGQKLSIVSHRPQTTRRRLIGIHSEPGLQVALVDTPGSTRPATDQPGHGGCGAGRADGVDVYMGVGRAALPERLRDGNPLPGARLSPLSERSGALVVALGKIDRVPRPQLLPLSPPSRSACPTRPSSPSPRSRAPVSTGSSRIGRRRSRSARRSTRPTS